MIPAFLADIWRRQFNPQGQETPANHQTAVFYNHQLGRLCSLKIPEGEAHNQRTAQKTIQDIQTYLKALDEKAGRHGNLGWARRPRIYAILRNIDATGLMDEFIAAGMTDFHLPLNTRTLPACLSSDGERDLRDAFNTAQHTYLTKARCIEEDDNSSHWLLPPHTSGDDYFHPVRRLGQGGFGSVDLVVSRLSIREYARKRVMRARSEHSRRNEDSLLNELKELRRLRHDHLIQILGSYTDREYIAYLMKPIAEGNLDQFLNRKTQLGPEEKTMLRRSYGCLAGAVDYLHRQQVRHRDLTSRNVLIYQGDFYISDFGSAYNWADKAGSMTRHRNTPVSPDYMAPEIARDKERGTASDMWSLGVVYLEMTTKLLGPKVRDFKNVLTEHAKHYKVAPYPHANIPAMFAWIKELGDRETEYDHDKEPLLWVRHLLEEQPGNRPTSGVLMRDIFESPSFASFCCFKCQATYQGDTAEHSNRGNSDPAVDSHNTRSWAENFMDAFESGPVYGGMPVHRVDSIKEWVSGTTGSDAQKEPASSGLLKDITEDDAELLDKSRLNKGLQYASYNVENHTGTSFEEPRAKQWDGDTEGMAVPGAYPTHTDVLAEAQERLPFPQPNEASRRAPRDDKQNLKDSGLGFLEYESVSSGNDGPTIRPYDEVSDCSTVDSENSLTGDAASYGGLETEISEDGDEDEFRIHDPGRAFEAIEDGGGTLFGEIVDESDPELQSSTLLNETSDISDDDPIPDHHRDMTSVAAADSRTIEAKPDLETCHALETEPENEKNQPPQERDAPEGKATGERHLIEEVELPVEYVSPRLPAGWQPFEDEQSSGHNLTTKKEHDGRALGKEYGICGHQEVSLVEDGHTAPTPVPSPVESRPFSARLSDVKDQQGGQDGNPSIKPVSNDGLKAPNETEISSAPPRRVTSPAPCTRSPLSTKYFTAADREKQPPLSGEPLTEAKKKKKLKKVVVGDTVHIPLGLSDFASMRVEPKASPGRKASIKRSGTPEREELPTINADKLMSETWEMASSMPTSVMSANTKSNMVKFFLMIPTVGQVQEALTAHCRKGKASAVRCMIENMHPPKDPGSFFRGALWACVNGASSRHNKCVRALIEAGANINGKRKKSGKTALHVAVEHDDFKGYTNLIWLLISNGANPNIRNASDDCPLTLLFTGNDSSPLKKHRLAALALLLQGGADVDASQPGTASTPLHLAVRRQDKLAVAMLLYKGADVNAKTKWGTTPLQIAANQFRGSLGGDHAQVLDLLLRGGADVDEPAGASGRTALHRAVVAGTAQAVEMLLRYGADASLKDGSGHDSRDLAVANAGGLMSDPSKAPDGRVSDHVEIMDRLFGGKGGLKRRWPMKRGKCVLDLAFDGDATVDGQGILAELVVMGLRADAKFGEKGSIAELAQRRGWPL